MKKLLLAVPLMVISLVVSGNAYAEVERVKAWEFKTPTEITLLCGGSEYTHTLEEVTQDYEDNLESYLEGEGYYNSDSSYTWNLTGEIEENDITFTVVYTGTNSGYTLKAEGTISDDGSIEGKITEGNCSEFSMPEGSVEMFTGNHGQWVSSSMNKREAAHSRIGMPVHSMGHRK